MRALFATAILFLATPALAQEPSAPKPDEVGGANTPPPPPADGAPPEATTPTGPASRPPIMLTQPPGNFDPTPPLSLFPTPDDALMDPRMARSWSGAPSRWFVATMVDVGFIYGRPRVSLGYGKPFTKSIGVDLNPVFNSGGVGVYGGGRLEIPYMDLRFGSRYWWLFGSWFLPEQDQYTRLDIAKQLGNKAKVLTHEAEVDFSIPAGPGNILARGSISYVADVPDGKAVFEPQLRVIVQKGLVWRARAGYAFRLGKYSQHSIGVVGDFLDVPTREDSKTVRVGPIIRFVLSRRVDIRGSFVTTVKSPDKIGLVGGDFTELGVRYRWASEPAPGREPQAKGSSELATW